MTRADAVVPLSRPGGRLWGKGNLRAEGTIFIRNLQSIRQNVGASPSLLLAPGPVLRVK